MVDPVALLVNLPPRRARFGSVGEGPGEFRFPSAIWSDGVGGSLRVWDSGSFAALTFSTGGAWLFSSRTPVRGATRSDVGTVTFGDPLRAVPVPGGLVVARYDSGVIQAATCGTAGWCAFPTTAVTQGCCLTSPRIYREPRASRPPAS